MFFQHSDFKFSEKAKNWILDQYHDKFQTMFEHVLDTSLSQQVWCGSIVGHELNEFLFKYNLDTNAHGIHALISNDQCSYNEPHIDFVDKSVVVKSRFNVMVVGATSDEMVWWPDWGCQDSRLLLTEYRDVHDDVFVMPSIPGSTPQDRWHTLGEPGVRTQDLYQNCSSAFVKTDCAHAVNVSPGPRLLITVGFDKPFEEIFNQ